MLKKQLFGIQKADGLTLPERLSTFTESVVKDGKYAKVFLAVHLEKIKRNDQRRIILAEAISTAGEIAG
jgi:hypothetical protein